MSSDFDLSAANRGAWSFHLFGVWVRVQIWFWVIALIIAADREPREVLIWVFAAFVSLLLHEFGHVIAYRMFSIDSSVILQAWGGLTTPRHDVYGVGARTLVSLAGPTAGFLITALVIFAGTAAGYQFQMRWWFLLPTFGFTGAPNASAAYYLMVLLNDLAFINLYWGLVNLLPVWPLDGGHVARAVWEHRDPYRGTKNSLILSAVAGGVAALFG